MKQLVYTKLTAEETKDSLVNINPYIHGSDIVLGKADIVSATLPFYQGYRFLEITDRMQNPVRKRFVVHKYNNITVLDYTNTPIYDLNKEAPIALSEDNVALYVHFFFSFVRGKHGVFQIVEGVDEIKWRDDPTPNARKSLSETIQPMVLISTETDGSYKVLANMIFKNALLQCVVTVTSNGFVTLSDEKLLIQDLPLLDDVMGV
jgi:hypothetical protein